VDRRATHANWLISQGERISRLEAIDKDLDQRGHFGRGGARSLLEHKARLGKELRMSHVGFLVA
jgi:hypothetical protein